MLILNAGCGGQRVHDDRFVNLDNLHEQLEPGTPERINLDLEKNYCNCDLLTEPIPFPDEHFDGVYLLHVLEHFTCHDAVEVLQSFRRVLRPGGVLVASVPDADYFERIHHDDTRDNAERLFGEPISEPQYETFFDYALFMVDHKQVLNMSGLWALLRKAGFINGNICRDSRNSTADLISEHLNRKKFSAILYAYT